jgi:thioredoxin-dependent peroxiredoxin
VKAGRWIGVAAVLIGVVGVSEALTVGDPAPNFSLPDHTGRVVRLSDFRGKQHVVLAFYIRAFTPG